MHISFTRIVRSLCIAAAVCLSVHISYAQTVSTRVVNAADKFLSRLDATQREKVLFSFDDDKQRVRWSNLPVTNVPRAGLRMGELNATQRSAALALVASVLSR